MPTSGNLVSSFIVFIGVVVGQLLAHWLTQLRDSKRRALEKNVLLRALETELIVNTANLRALCERSKLIIDSSPLPPPSICTIVSSSYQATLPDIEEFGKNTALDVVKFYVTLEAMKSPPLTKETWHILDENWKKREWKSFYNEICKIAVQGDRIRADISEQFNRREK